MNRDTVSWQVKRWHIAAPLVLLQLWPFHLVLRAYTSVPDVRAIFADLLEGKELPAISQFVVHTYHYWLIVPTITTGLALMCFSKRVNSPVLPAFTLVLTILASYGLDFLWTEGVYAPFRFMIANLAR